MPPPRGDTSHGPVYGENLKREPARGFALPDTALLGYPPPGAGDAGILKGGGPQNQVIIAIPCDWWRSISHVKISLKIR